MLAVKCTCDFKGCTEYIVLDKSKIFSVTNENLIKFGWSMIKNREYCETHTQMWNELDQNTGEL